MKHQSYLDRALKSGDRRFARIFGKLGYDTTALGNDETTATVVVDIAALRAEYHGLFGKKPFAGWDADALRGKIAEKRKDP